MPFWEIYSYFYSLSLRNSFPYKCLLKDLGNALNIRGDETILDAGCGPGLVMESIIQENEGKRMDITGLDLSKKMLEHAYRRCNRFSNVKLKVADLNKSLEFPNSYFDKVICSNTLYALGNPHAVISEFHRVLKQGGAVIIANPKPNAGEKQLIRAHLRAIRRLTPLHRKINHILLLLLLTPVNLVVIAMSKVIIAKGKSREYQFLDRETLQRIFEQVGFKNIDIGSCYVDQDWLVTAQK